MRLFDENLKEVFLYQYTDGNEEGISRLRNLYSYRKISYEEIIEAANEYNKLKKERSMKFDEAEEVSGLKKIREIGINIRNKDASQDIVYAKYLELTKDIGRMINCEDFLIKRFDLKELEMENL